MGVEVFFDVLDLLASHFGGRRRGKVEKKNFDFFSELSGSQMKEFGMGVHGFLSLERSC